MAGTKVNAVNKRRIWRDAVKPGTPNDEGGSSVKSGGVARLRGCMNDSWAQIVFVPPRTIRSDKRTPVWRNLTPRSVVNIVALVAHACLRALLRNCTSFRTFSSISALGCDLLTLLAASAPGVYRNHSCFFLFTLFQRSNELIAGLRCVLASR